MPTLASDHEQRAPPPIRSVMYWIRQHHLTILEYVKVIVFSGGTLMLAFFGYQFSKHTAIVQQQNTSRQIEAEIARKTFEERRAAQQLTTALLPAIGCDVSIRRDIAIELLAAYASEQKMIVTSLLQRCQAADPKTIAHLQEVRVQSSGNEVEAEFLQLVQNARLYYRYDQKSDSARVFQHAADTLPIELVRRGVVHLADVVAAQKAYADHQFDEAADRHMFAFRKVADR